MKVNEFLETLSAEEYMTYLGRLTWFGSLPDKEKYSEILDKDFVVSYKNMKTDNDVKYALMLASEINMYIDLAGLDSESVECDDLCFLCELQLANIMKFWFGIRKYREDRSWILECIRDAFWDYMRGDINFEEFKINVTDYNKKYIN